MHVRVRRAFVAAALTLPITAAAQEPGDKADADDASKAEAPAPEDKKADAPAEPVPDDAEKPAKFSWEPYGYLRMQYVFSQNDPNVQFVGRDDGFELQNARVGVRGKLG